MVRIDRLERALRRMPDKALIKFVKRCVYKVMFCSGTESEAPETLDLVFLEFSRRGKERLYDTIYASVASHPERFEIH